MGNINKLNKIFKMTVTEQHLLNGVTFRDGIQTEFESQKEFITSLNRNLIMALAFDNIEDVQHKESLFETIREDEIDAKKIKATELLNFYVNENFELLGSAGLDHNTDQAAIVADLILLTKLNVNEQFENWSIIVDFKDEYSFPKIIVEKV